MRRLLEPSWNVPRENGLHPERLEAPALPLGSGIGLDPLKQVAHPLPILLRRQMRPARKRGEHLFLFRGVLQTSEVFPPIAGRILPAAMEPQAFDHLPVGGVLALTGSCAKLRKESSPQREANDAT